MRHILSLITVGLLLTFASCCELPTAPGGDASIEGIPQLAFPYTINPLTSGVAPDVEYWPTASDNRGFVSTDRLVKGWCQAIPIKDCLDLSPQPQVEVEWMRVDLIRSGQSQVILYDDHGDGQFTINDGALYQRSPWYDGSFGQNLAAQETVGVLTVWPRQPSAISHWWTSGWWGPQAGDGYRMTVRFRVTGGALFQFGIDLKKFEGEDKVSPAVISDWYGATQGQWITRSIDGKAGYSGATPGPDLKALAQVNIRFSQSPQGVPDLAGDWDWSWRSMTGSGLSWSSSVLVPWQTSTQFNVRFQDASGTTWGATAQGTHPQVTSVVVTVPGVTIVPTWTRNPQGTGGNWVMGW